MEKATLMTIVVIVWAAYVWDLSASAAWSGGCHPPHCINGTCTGNRICVDDHCLRCLCYSLSECRYNNISKTVYCDCGPNRYGKYCYCNETAGCGCADTFGLKTSCSDFSDDFSELPGKKLQGLSALIPNSSVNNLADCKNDCISYGGCSVIALQRGGKALYCNIYDLNFANADGGIISDPLSNLYFRRCTTCDA